MPNLMPPNSRVPAGESFSDMVQVDPAWVGGLVYYESSIRPQHNTVGRRITYQTQIADTPSGPWTNFGIGGNWRGGSIDRYGGFDFGGSFGPIPAEVSGKWVRMRFDLSEETRFGIVIDLVTV